MSCGIAIRDVPDIQFRLAGYLAIFKIWIWFWPKRYQVYRISQPDSDWSFLAVSSPVESSSGSHY